MSGTELDYRINESGKIFKIIIIRMLIGMVIVKIIMNALPKKRKELLQTLLSMIGAGRREKGCLNYQVFQDIENDNIFCLIEEWESREDLEHHMRSAGFSVLLGTKFLLNKDHDIQIHTLLESEKARNASDIIK